MSNLIINPWDIAEDTKQAVIPSFVQGKFILMRIAAPKGKTVRDGLVAHLGLISYKTEDGKEVTMTEVTKTSSGFTVEFPSGKRGILSTKFRGPKNWYKFRRPDGSWFQIGTNDPVTKINDKFTPEYAEKRLSATVKEWSSYNDIERDNLIDEYLEGMFMFGLAMDFNLPMKEEIKEIELPFVGMVTEFYRQYTPPAKGEKYGNTIITKFAPREGKETLSGDYTRVDAEIAVAIHTKLQEREEERFDPAVFGEDDEDVI